MHGPESHQGFNVFTSVSSPFMVPGSKQQLGDGPGRLKEEGAKCHREHARGLLGVQEDKSRGETES